MAGAPDARVRLAAIDHDEMRQPIVEAWVMVVPRKVWTRYVEQHPGEPG